MRKETAAAALLIILFAAAGPRPVAATLAIPAGVDPYEVDGANLDLSLVPLQLVGLGLPDTADPVVPLAGVPADRRDLGNSAVVISRAADIYLPGIPSSATTPIALDAFELESMQPILLVTQGGETKPYDVSLSLSPVATSAGVMGVVQVDSNGGVFELSLSLSPRLTLTSGDDVRVVDYGENGLSPVVIETSGSWTTQCDDALQVPNGTPGFCPGGLAGSTTPLPLAMVDPDFTLILFALRALGETVVPDSATFDQVHYAADHSGHVPCSEYGVIGLNVMPDPCAVRYVQVIADVAPGQDPQAAWVVRNLPVLPRGEQEADVVRVETTVDLSDLGVSRGDCLNTTIETPVHYGAIVSSQPMDTTPVVVADPSLPFVTGFGSVTNNADCMLASFPGAGSLPAASVAPFSLLPPFVSIFAGRAGMESVEQGKNECAPGATASSMHWLDASGAITLPGDPKPTLSETLEELKIAMNPAAAEPPFVGGTYPGALPSGIVEGKLRFAADRNLDLDIHYQADATRTDLEESVSVTVDGQTYTAARDGDGGPPTFDFVLEQMLLGQDIEVSIDRLNDADVVSGNHAMTISGVLTVANFMALAFNDDNEQDAAGGLRRFHWGQVTIDANGYMRISGIPKNRIIAVYAESPRAPADSDGDGVSHGFDLCGDSAPGAVVDSNGCSDPQVDEDCDRVCDPGAPSGGPSGCVGEDECPGTPLGEPVDQGGCSASQRISSCVLSPSVAINPVQTTHTTTVTVTRDGIPAAGVSATFRIISGPNSATSAPQTKQTDSNGQASFEYVGGGVPGTDQLEVSGEIFICTATKHWVTGSEQPPSARCRDVFKQVGPGGIADVGPDEVDDGSTDPDGQIVSRTLDPAGPFPLGETMVTLTVTDDDGFTDSCTATIRVVDLRCAIEPVQAVNYVDPANPADSVHDFSVFVRSSGQPVAGATVVYAIVVGPNIGTTGNATTDAAGIARFSYADSGGLGSDGIDAVAILGDAVSAECQANKTWEPTTVSCTVSPENATNPVGSTHDFVVTVMRDGMRAAGASVGFGVVAGPNAGAVGSATTDADGQAELSYSSNGREGEDTILVNAEAGGVEGVCGAAKKWAAASIQDLIDDLQAVGLKNGLAKSLAAKLEAAQESIDRGNERAAVRQLQAFTDQVRALERARLLTPSQAEQLIGSATDLIDQIGASR